MTIINTPRILEKISRDKRLSSTMLKNAKITIDSAKKEMIHDFNIHDVTQEIEGGLEAENKSGTLGKVKGNLSSWFGFRGGKAITNPIRNLLNNLTRVRESKKEVRNNKIRYIYTVETPSKEQIFEVGAESTPIEVGGSWIRYIEVGMRGLKLYISIQGARKKWLKRVIEKYSRTKHALQIDINKIREFEVRGQKRNVVVKEGRYNVRFKNIPYISEILNKFRKRLGGNLLE